MRFSTSSVYSSTKCDGLEDTLNGETDNTITDENLSDSIPSTIIVK